MGYTHGKEWSDDLVKIEILKVMRALNINRMPTRKEIELVTQNSSLTNRISRTKGYYGWAEELGLSLKPSETNFGKEHEYLVKELLEHKGYQVIKMAQNYPFDLLVNNNIKVDVKTSRLYKGTKGEFYTFNLEKKYASCDIYIAICINDENKIEKLLIIPSSKLKISQLSIGKNSIYDIYKDAFEWLEKYDSFYSIINEIG